MPRFHSAAFKSNIQAAVIAPMDAMDVRIFCEMAFKYADYDGFSDRRISPKEIGAKLGLDEKTVRLRVKKLEEDEFIKYYQALPNLALFGYNELCSLILEAPDITAKQAALQHFLRVPSVVEVDDFQGPMFSVGLGAASPEEAIKSANSTASEVGVKVHPNVLERKTRPPLLQPDKLDWKLMASLRYDALRPMKDISDSTSITYRMAEFRLSRLLDSRVFYVTALLNSRKQQGIIFYGLILFVDPLHQSHLISQSKKIHGDKLWLYGAPDDHTIFLNLFSLTSGGPEDAVLATSKLEGVKQYFLMIHRERFEPSKPSWIDQAIEDKATA
jgi:DNA-binding Lrp family transcriptional regulator